MTTPAERTKKINILIPILNGRPVVSARVVRQEMRWTNHALENAARELVDYIWYNSSSLYVESVYDELRRRLGYDVQQSAVQRGRLR